MLLVGAFLVFNYVWGLFHPRFSGLPKGIEVPATVYDPEHPQGVSGSARVGAITPGSGISPLGDRSNLGVGGR